MRPPLNCIPYHYTHGLIFDPVLAATTLIDLGISEMRAATHNFLDDSAHSTPIPHRFHTLSCYLIVIVLLGREHKTHLETSGGIK